MIYFAAKANFYSHSALSECKFWTLVFGFLNTQIPLLLLLLSSFLRSSIQTKLFACIDFTAISMSINKSRCSPVTSPLLVLDTIRLKRPEQLCMRAGRKRWEGERTCSIVTIIKAAEWFSLRHLRRSWSQIQQVSCSSAEGLVIRGLAGVSGGGGGRWWLMAMGWMPKL